MVIILFAPAALSKARKDEECAISWLKRQLVGPNWKSHQLYFVPKINTGAAKDSGDLTVIQSCSVVLDADGVFLLVELDLAHAVNLPGVVQRRHLFLTRRRSIFENHVEQGHSLSSVWAMNRG